LDHLGKLIIELNTETLISSGELLELYPNTCLTLSNDETLLYTQGESFAQLLDRSGVGDGDVVEYLKDSQTGLRDDYYHVSCRIDSYSLRLDIFIPADSIYSSVQETTACT
jgi:hypothetical protein